MSGFKVNVVAVNPKREDPAAPPLEALVDTGSELTWLPAEALKQSRRHGRVDPFERIRQNSAHREGKGPRPGRACQLIHLKEQPYESEPTVGIKLLLTILCAVVAAAGLYYLVR